MAVDPDELLRLKRDLQADDPVLRDAAVRQMPTVVVESVMPALTEALLSDSVQVRRQAVLLLGRLCDVDSRALFDPVPVSLESPEARAAIEEFLGDDDPEVRRCAAYTLEVASSS